MSQTNRMSLMRAPSVYTTGRVFAVVTKPLCLFLANNYFSTQAAEGLAVTFLASSLMLVAIGADAHRWFYKRHFSLDRERSSATFYVYAGSVCLLVIAGMLGVIGIVWTVSASAALAFVAGAYFCSEKLADERLRIRLFEQRFDDWGAAAMARTLIQTAGLLAMYAFLRASVPSWLAVLALLAGNVIVFLPGLPPGVWRVLWSWPGQSRLWLVRRSARSLARNWRLWATALATSAVGQFDRVIALGVDAALLPVFVLVIMAFSIVQMMVDYYYVSIHRRAFLRGEITMTMALANPGLIGSLVGGVAVATVVCVAVLAFSKSGAELPLTYVIAIAIFQVAISIAAIPQMIVYWSHRFDWVLWTEAAFWAVLVATTLSWQGASNDPAALIGSAAGITILRLLAYWLLSSRLPAPALVDASSRHPAAK